MTQKGKSEIFHILEVFYEQLLDLRRREPHVRTGERILGSKGGPS